jgi:hypothetical protein
MWKSELLKKYIKQCNCGIGVMKTIPAFKNWGIEKKKLMDDISIKNVSSVLGEIRALGLIYYSFLGGNNLECTNKNKGGADFTPLVYV